MLLARLGALFAPLLVLTSLTAGSVVAQTYPAKPIRTITNIAGGGTYDVFIRVLGEQLQKRLGQPLIVEPRPGGNFTIAGRVCAEAAADGYTMCALSGDTLFATLLNRDPGFDGADFVPVTNLFFNTQMMVINASLNVKSVAELEAYARAKPSTLAYVAPSASHAMVLERFSKQWAADMVSIPFKGGAEAMTGILSGNVPIGFFGAANFVSQVRAGKVHPLVVDGASRSPLFPNVPTLAEVGYQGRVARNYLGLVLPKGSPASVAARLHREITAVMQDKAFNDTAIVARGLEPVASSPEEFARFLQEDRVNLAQIIKEAGLKPQ